MSVVGHRPGWAGHVRKFLGRKAPIGQGQFLEKEAAMNLSQSTLPGIVLVGAPAVSTPKTGS